MMPGGYARGPVAYGMPGGGPAGFQQAPTSMGAHPGLMPTMQAVPQQAVPQQAVPMARGPAMPVTRTAALRPVQAAAVPLPRQPSYQPLTRQPTQPQPTPSIPVVVAGPAKPPPPPDAAVDEADHDLRPGDWVKLAGIAHNPDYQDKAFQIEQANVGDGRVMAKFSHNGVIKKLYLEASALEKVDPEAYGLPANGSAGSPTAAGLAGVGSMLPPPVQQLAGKVRIVGLRVRPEHDGKFAQVLPPGIPDATGRVKVQVEGPGLTVLEIPPSYLEPVAAEDTAAAAPQDEATEVGGLRHGERVQIHNLASRPHHNGRTGVVESLDSVSSTLVVALDNVGADGVGRLSLSPNYLKSLDAPAPTIAIDSKPEPIIQATVTQTQAGCVAASGALQPGERVKVINLAARPDYDGQTCRVESVYDEATGEVVVAFEAPGLAKNRLVLGPGYLERCQ